jgi:hypothetical protein
MWCRMEEMCRYYLLKRGRLILQQGKRSAGSSGGRATVPIACAAESIFMVYEPHL